MDVQTLKVQFPEVRFYTYAGRGPHKRIKGQLFPVNVAVPVWDRKVQILMRKLAYMKEVPIEQIEGGLKAAPKKQIEVPDNWWDLHHKKRIAMANALTNGGDIHSASQADDILAKIKPRPAPEVVKAPAVEQAA